MTKLAFALAIVLAVLADGIVPTAPNAAMACGTRGDGATSNGGG